jgi:1,4-dihydroxy-2-naphthoate octaprenyltransferase
MPVYWFALSQLSSIDWVSAILIFLILHILVYPASNGYNSYMDRDETPIGGLKKPSLPTRQLYEVCFAMDLLAIVLGFLISIFFATGIFAYILASRAYSSRSIRLKKRTWLGYLTVIFFQGAVCFFLVYHGSDLHKTLHVPKAAMLASSFLIGGFYPLTQIYQHVADLLDGVQTLSYRLGYRGTFIFSLIMYCLAFGTLGYYLFSSLEEKEFFVFSTSMLPFLVYFFIWVC